jgi:predicted TIM-barrel fold metal-dependent hydrolase
MAALAELIDDLPLVDHHVHGAFRTDADEARFQNALNEGNTAALRDPSSSYDTQLGFAVRRWCAHLLDLPARVPADEYWARRRDLGELEVARRMTSAAGVSDWLMDTGFRSDDLSSPEQLASLSGGNTFEVVRVEALAETIVGRVSRPGDYGDAFRAALGTAPADRAGRVVGAKSVIAYRGGFDRDLSRPKDREVTDAVARWHERLAGGAVPRLTDSVLLRFGLHAATDAALPLQLHVGLGDRDLHLGKSNPLHLIDFLRAHDSTGVPVVLLHCYPYEREAGYLAEAFETVHFDVGLAANHLGVRSTTLMARALELAPFGKVLYSSDAFGPAELHYLGAVLWRNAMNAVVGRWVDDGDWSQADARRVVTNIGRDNARRIYRLD